MKRVFISLFLILNIMSGSVSLFSQAAEEYAARRRQVIDRMEPGSVMIIRTAGESGRFDYEKKGGYFRYLAGFEEPECMLVLFAADFKSPAVPGGNQVLFIRPVNRERKNWDAQTLGLEGAREIYGFQDVRPSAEAPDYAGRLLAGKITVLYIELPKASSVLAPLAPGEMLVRSAREHGAAFTTESPGKILLPLISVKSPAEAGLLQQAVSITAEAQREAMRTIRGGLYEYQVDALIRYVFGVNGAGGVSFPTIVGSGINSVILHWMENSRRMEDGDLVVVDCGAEYGMYCADITRTYPVNGKFTARQREIYEIVLAANQEAIKRVGPGVPMTLVNSAADSVIAEGLLRIGLISDRSEFRKYYYHGLSHQIGLRGEYGGLVQVLEPGMVITIEPGIYVREEKTGVRIEDDVLVTATGYEVLSDGAPKTVSEIEKGMKESGTDLSKNLVGGTAR